MRTILVVVDLAPRVAPPSKLDSGPFVVHSKGQNPVPAAWGVVVSVIYFPMGLFYYPSDNGADYTISARNPAAATAMKR